MASLSYQDPGQDISKQNAKNPMVNAPDWIQNDYWAPDRNDVLNDPTRWGTGPNGQVDPRTTAAQQPAAQPQAPAGNDYRSQLAAIYQRNGLDPNNPGAGLANEDYFLGRAGQTGNDMGYWGNRLQNEINTWRQRGAVDVTGDGGAPNGVYTNWQGGGGGPWGDQVRSAIMQLIQGGGTDLSKSVEPQAQAFDREQERNVAAQRAELAQRLQASGQGAVEGGSSGALESGMMGIRENAGNQSSAFHAKLVGQELENRRGQLMQALQMGAGLLSQDQQLALQRELASINASLQQQQMAQNSDQFQASLNQRNYELGF